MIKEKILNFMRRNLSGEQSPHRVALSASVGVFIAFSPYHFFHTILIFVLSWLMGLNLVITFAVTHLINNPWTMVFIYGVDHLVGDFILGLMGYSPLTLNPSWMELINKPLRTYTGVEGIAFWSFMIGGNLLAILFSVMLYPIVKRLFIRMKRSQLEKHEG